MLYDIQAVQRSKEGVPVLVTDLVTSNKLRVFDRVKELNGRRQQCRVIPQYGRGPLNDREIQDLRR